jgi:hypothetical protein
LEINRAEISFDPPTFQGTTSFISLVGKSAATAEPKAKMIPKVKANFAKTAFLQVFMFTPLTKKHI